METELAVLAAIDDNQDITQRVLAREANLSLGAVNVLLKKMYDKGLIKIEKLSPRTVRYMLTPKGLVEKAQKTYHYMKRTYKGILAMRNELERLVERVPVGGTVCLHGEMDDIHSMVLLLLRDIAKNRGIEIICEIVCDTVCAKASESDLVIVWSGEAVTEGANCVNILDRIV